MGADIYPYTLGQGEPAPPTWCFHLLEQGLLELIINRGNVKFGLKDSDLLRGWDGMLIMFRTKPKEFGVLMNCASVKAGLFFLQICGIKNLVKFSQIHPPTMVPIDKLSSSKKKFII